MQAWLNQYIDAQRKVYDAIPLAEVERIIGTVKEVSARTIMIEDTHYGRLEDAQMTILHMICYAFMEGGAA